MTETQTLEALLRRWAELEPLVVYLQTDGHGRLLCVHIDNEWFVYDDCAFRMRMVLQCAAQEAIEARSWSWDLDACYMDNEEKRMYGATVYVVGDFCESREYTPAAALLSAYLQALEAQA